MPIDALITDLDGTLLRRDRPVDARNAAAVQRWLASGRPLLIATARGPGSAACVLGGLRELCRRGVFHTGAIGLCRDTGFSAADLLEAADVAAVCALAQAARPDATIGLTHPERGMAVSRPLPGDAIADWGVDPGDLRDFGEAQCDDACKVTVWSQHGHPLHDLAALLEERLEGAVDCHPADGGTCLLVTAAGVSKASMLKRLLAHLELDPDRCAAIGDDITDVPMLDMVGLPIAIAGGHKAALGHAERIAAPPEEGGWAVAVDRLLTEG